jgi:hypothetical protein
VNRDEPRYEVKPYGEPAMPSSLFAMPPTTGGELVPTNPFDLAEPANQVPDSSTTSEQPSGAGITEQQRQPHTWLGQQPVTSLALSPADRAAQEAERDRLLGLCRQLQRTHRCPGECVLSPGRQERILRQIEGADGRWSP